MNFWTRFATTVRRLIPFCPFLPPAAADRRQLLRSGLQPASGGHQHHRGNPALHRQRRRHDLGGGVRLPRQHGGFRGHAQRQTEEGKRFRPDKSSSPFTFPSFFSCSAFPRDSLAVGGGVLFPSLRQSRLVRRLNAAESIFLSPAALQVAL